MLVNPGSKVHMPVLQATANRSGQVLPGCIWHGKTDAGMVLLQFYICVLARTSSYTYCSLQLAESTGTWAAACEHPEICCRLHPAVKLAI